MAKISDVRELVPRPLQQNEIGGRAQWIAWIAHEERRASVNQPGDKMPIVDISVVVKVPPNLAPALHASPVDELQSHLIGQHVADGIEVTRVETVDVLGQQR